MAEHAKRVALSATTDLGLLEKTRLSLNPTTLNPKTPQKTL